MDKRTGNRIEWDVQVKYRMLQVDTYKPSILKNISDSGALLWLKDDIAVGSKLEILLQSEDDPVPVNMHMRVVRTEQTPYRDYTGYGCKLEMTVSEVA